jgi:hypothetical protein
MNGCIIWAATPCSPLKVNRQCIISTLENILPLGKFKNFGTYNVIEELSECCRRVRELVIPHIELSVALLEVTMELLS